MNNRIALVTGGSKGLGKAIARRLCSDGFAVHICGRDIPELEAARDELSPQGTVAVHRLDLADTQAVAAFAASWSTPLHVLVNNAGVFTLRTQEGTAITGERLDEPSNDLFETIMQVNVAGLYHLTKGLLRHIPDNGRIINIASQLASAGRESMGVYSASKHAVIGFTRTWALELGKRGITVNAVSPAWASTTSNMNDVAQWAREEGVTVQEKLRALTAGLVHGRMVTPEEVAAVVSFLASEEASGVTGQDIRVGKTDQA